MSGIANIKLAGLDSNIFIYQFEDHPEFSQNTNIIFEKLAKNKLKAVTSIISLIEALSYPSPPEVRTKIKEGFSVPNLIIFDINQSIGLEVARLRREYGLRLADAAQLATTQHAKAKAFITNDERLKKFKELKVILLSELNFALT